MGSEKWKGNEFRMDDGTRLGGSWGERDERDGWGEGACDESTGDVNGAWGESACDGSDSDAKVARALCCRSDEGGIWCSRVENAEDGV